MSLHFPASLPRKRMYVCAEATLRMRTCPCKLNIDVTYGDVADMGGTYVQHAQHLKGSALTVPRSWACAQASSSKLEKCVFAGRRRSQPMLSAARISPLGTNEQPVVTTSVAS